MSYDMLTNTDSAGHDIKQFANMSVDDCKKNCNNVSNCGGFGIDRISRYGPSCYLKDNTMYPKGTKQNLSNFDIYYKTNYLETSNDYNLLRNTDSAGNDIDSKRVGGPQDCLNLCNY